MQRSPHVWSPPAAFASPAADHAPEPAELGADPRAEPFVAHWRERLTQAPPRVLDAYLARAETWQGQMVPILAAHSVPSEFLYLALLESGMQPHARSAAEAVGIWQFTAETARQYGLLVDDGADQRTDELLSTRAAGRYLRDLFEAFGSWELAAAAYNAGPGRVERAMARTGAESYWDLIEVAHLPAETRAYVPRFLALIQLARERAVMTQVASTRRTAAD